MSGLSPTDHDLLQPASKRPSWDQLIVSKWACRGKFRKNCLDIPDTRGNDILANQGDEWKEFLSNSQITISEPTQRHDNYAVQLVSDCNGDNEWCVLEEGTSGVADTLLQEPDMTENVEKIITFSLGEGTLKYIYGQRLWIPVISHYLLWLNSTCYKEQNNTCSLQYNM